MTAIRKSLLFGFEDEFGMGLGANQHWFAPPPGSFISHTHNRATNRVNATGSKKYDFIAYGKYSGTWDWSFYLDYDYLEPLKCMFEKEDRSWPDSDDYIYVAPLSVGEGVFTAYGTLTSDCIDDNGRLWTDGEHQQEITTNSAIFAISDLEGQYFAKTRGSAGVDPVWMITPLGSNGLGYEITGDNFMYYGRPMYNLGENTTLSMKVYYDDGPHLMGVHPGTDIVANEDFDEENHYRYLLTQDDQSRQLYDPSSTPVFVKAPSERHLKKINEGRVPSMVFRIVTLNRMAGGELDEILEVRGCVCKSMRFSNSAGNSQWGVSLSGFCTREVMWLGRLAHTDYRKHDGELTQFACLFTGAEANKDTYVANCDSIQISIENNAEVLDSTCTPYSPWYFEQITNYALTAVVYSFDPMLFKQRLYAGGQSLEQYTGKKNYTSDETEMDELYHDADKKKSLPPGTSEAITDDGKHVKYLTTPLCKKLAPAKDFLVVSYDACRNDLAISQESTDTLMDAINISKNRIQFHFIDTVIKALSWQRGDGQKIMDSLSSAECWEIDITVKTDRDTIINPNNYMTPIGPVYDNQKRIWIDPATNQEANTDKEWS